MKYKIKVTYDTGNSFGNELGLEDYIEADFDTIELAERNAKNIMEHYEMYEEVNSYRSRGNAQEIMAKYKDKEWFNPQILPFIQLDEKTTMRINESEVEKYTEKGNKIIYQYDEFSTCYAMNLFITETESIRYSCGMWCGYFETLCGVEVTTQPMLKLNRY